MRKAAIPADLGGLGQKFSHHTKQEQANALPFTQEQGLRNSTALYRISFCTKHHQRCAAVV